MPALAYLVAAQGYSDSRHAVRTKVEAKPLLPNAFWKPLHHLMHCQADRVNALLDLVHPPLFSLPHPAHNVVTLRRLLPTTILAHLHSAFFRNTPHMACTLRKGPESHLLLLTHCLTDPEAVTLWTSWSKCCSRTPIRASSMLSRGSHMLSTVG
jgi:hypothetical protein